MCLGYVFSKHCVTLISNIPRIEALFDGGWETTENFRAWLCHRVLLRATDYHLDRQQ
jgi:hypothetical protein